MNPFADMLAEICVRKIPVVIGADAHEPGRVADRYEVALDLLPRVGFPEVSLFLDRQRQTVPIHVARQTLRKARRMASSTVS
jgi:histidinol-phosphatase (PHP family)